LLSPGFLPLESCILIDGRFPPIGGVKSCLFGQLGFMCLMRHGVDVISPSSWEPQEEGMISTAGSFPSVRNQGLSYPGKSQTPEGDAC
jgi:hypothetical protein